MGWGQTAAKPLPTQRTTQTQNKCTQRSMPCVGFEPMIPVFEQVKTVHALDHVATVIGGVCNLAFYKYFNTDFWQKLSLICYRKM
jgi:hypothetical protein